MKKIGLWSISVVFALIFFLLASMPAIQVLGRADLPKNVSVVGISGSLWHGKATRISVGNLSVDGVIWDINPWALLSGRLSLELEGGDMRDSEAVSVTGPVSVSLFNMQQVDSKGLLIYLPADPVVAQAQLPIRVNMGGRFRLRFEDLSMSPECNTLVGWGDWLNASIELPEGQTALGNFTAALTCEGDQFEMEVKEPNTLGLSFKALIQPDFKQFTVEGQFKPADDLPDIIRKTGQFFGTPEADGYTRFNL